MKNVLRFATVLFFCALILSCSFPQDSRETGSLVLSFIPATSKGSKNLLPPVDMEIASFDVSGIGPGGTTFSRLDIALSTTYVMNALVRGAWTITVDGNNAAGIRIGSGTILVTIIAGQAVSAVATLTPLSGTGTLDLTLSWPAGLLAAPGASGTLTAVDGSSSVLSFAQSADSLSTRYSNAQLASGYYSLSIILKDGTSPVWGGLEAVRIVAGSTTTGTFNLQLGDITDFTRNTNITITPAMDNPLPITLQGQLSVIALQSSMSVVVLNSYAIDSYQWFLNGLPLSGQTQSSVTVGSTLSAGNYRLDLLARKGNVLGSKSHAFSVLTAESISAIGWRSLGGPGEGNGANQFSYPHGIVQDAVGRTYVADRQNDRIVRIDDMSGAGWVSFGTLGSGINQFNNPVGVAVDRTGRIYVVDAGNSRIVRIDDMSGAGWVSFGALGSGTGQYNFPFGVALDANDRIYVADYSNSRITVMSDMNGTGWTTFGTLGSAAGQFRGPTGIALDAVSRIYVADYSNSRIVRVNDLSGAGWTTLGSKGNDVFQFTYCAGVTVDGSGHIYVTDRGGDNNRVVRVDNMNGDGWVAFGTQGSGTYQFSGPSGIFVDADRRIAVGDVWAHRIVQFRMP